MTNREIIISAQRLLNKETVSISGCTADDISIIHAAVAIARVLERTLRNKQVDMSSSKTYLCPSDYGEKEFDEVEIVSYCPSCGRGLNDISQYKYCSWCGQCLD